MDTIKRIEIVLRDDGTLESKSYGINSRTEMNIIINTLAHRLYELKLPEEGLKLSMSYITKSLMENISALKEMETLHE